MTSTPRNPQPFLDELLAWATASDDQKADLLIAKTAWFTKTGEVFDDDRQLEVRMSGFLEHYLCDRVAPHFGMTPAQARYLHALKTESPARAQGFRALTETIHGMFEIRKKEAGLVRLRSLFHDLDIDVTERRQLVALNVGDILEARLVPYMGAVHFTPAYCWHSSAAFELILAEARVRRQKRESEEEFIAECAQRSLKADRYRQIAIEKIYDFSHHKL